MGNRYFARSLMVATVLILNAACAQVIPGSFEVASEPPGAPDGKVLAVTSGEDRVFAATDGGLFRILPGEAWERVEIPGLKRVKSITSLAVLGDELFLGTKGEGLFILSRGTWEVKTQRYGGLPDDRVHCIAVDGGARGMPGLDVWVGTASGFAVRRNGVWEVYTPEGRWLEDLVSPVKDRGADIFASGGFRFGAPGEEKRTFKPPVSTIGIGNETVVLGSVHSRLAVLRKDVYSTVGFYDNLEVTSLLVGNGVIWCGTSSGLIWGGLSGVARGRPYPDWKGHLGTASVLFGGRDTRVLDYRWYRVGFRTTNVADMEMDDRKGLWIAYNGESTQEDPNPNLVRRYLNIDEHIAARTKPIYEEYGKSSAIFGKPAALAFSGKDGGMWVGSSKGIVHLK